MMRYSIGDEDSELFSEHRTPGGAVRNVVTEAPRSASFSNSATEAGRGLPNPRRMSQYTSKL